MTKYPNDSYRCPKCGCSQFNVDYRMRTEVLYFDRDLSTPEHMVIQCQKCGFRFITHPKDYSGE